MGQSTISSIVKRRRLQHLCQLNKLLLLSPSVIYLQKVIENYKTEILSIFLISFFFSENVFPHVYVSTVIRWS